MVDHVSNKGISAHGHLFWAVLMGIFILGSAHLEYLGWLLLFCKCGHVAAACNVVCDKPNRLSSWLDLSTVTSQMMSIMKTLLFSQLCIVSYLLNSYENSQLYFSQFYV